MKLFSLLSPIFLAGFGAVSANAALTAVFEYQFNGSYDASTTAVNDLSPANNDGTVTGENLGQNIALSTDIPAGGTKGTHSLDYSTTFGLIATNNVNLLPRSAVAASGGFTIMTSFKGLSGNLRKIIDVEGTEFIGAQDNNRGEVLIGLSNSGIVLTLGTAQGLDVTGWNDIKYEFVVTDASNPNNVIGDVRVTLNGTTTTAVGAAMTDFYDGLNRPIGIGRHPASSGEHFRGQIYAPAVYLGVVPEPSSVVLLGLGALAVLRRRRR